MTLLIKAASLTTVFNIVIYLFIYNRLSFPSGHASSGAFSMVYIAVSCIMC